MTTPAAHIPATSPDYRRLLPYLMGLVVAAIAVATVFSLGIPGDDPVPTTEADNVREWTRPELLDHLARINGFTPGATSGPSAEAVRQATLEELYRIDGVFPTEPAVPAAVR